MLWVGAGLAVAGAVLAVNVMASRPAPSETEPAGSDHESYAAS